LTFAVRIQNDGTQTDDIVVTAPTSSGVVFVRYFFSFFDITPYVTSSGFAFRSLAPGSAVQIGVRFEVPPSAPVDLIERRLVTFTSVGDSNRADAVRLRVTTQAS
jgi:hypothetical protein